MTPVTAAAVHTVEQWAFFDALATIRDRVVPVVGAGLAERAGAPSSAALVAALQLAAGEIPAAEPLFAAADRLAELRGEDWVRDQVAAVGAAAELRPTPVLLALARTRSRLIVTTNYDDALEVAARHAGVDVERLTLVDLARALEPADQTLRVLHLHGVNSRPDSLILTRASYDAALHDERLRQVLRSIALGHRLLLLGHALHEREKHLRRDLLWASETIAASGLATAPGEHLLLTGRRDKSADASLAVRAQNLRDEAGVHLLAISDPEQGYWFVNAAAHVLSGPAVADRADLAPTIGAALVDTAYLPLTVAPAKEIATASARGAYMAKTWGQGDVRADDLDERERRLVLVGGGGFGKTQELLQIARRSPGCALYKRLAGVRPPAAGLDPAAVFVGWMHDALSVSGDTPRLTLKRLREQAFVLLLDGFDEVPSQDRPAVAALLNGVVRSHPQHRWVLTSRQLPEDLPALEGFTAWAMLPDHNWLTGYAALRGVELEDLNARLGAAPGIDELAVIPVYATGVLRHVMNRTPLPATPRELVLQLADEHLDDGGRIPARPDLIRCWLDRVALQLQLRGAHELGIAELLALPLHQDLPGLAPDALLLAELATRALLVDEGGIVRFPANVVQEARAARALKDAGDEGLETLRQVVRVTLRTSSPLLEVPAVRSSWSNTLMLTLPDAPATWRELVQNADPMLAARLTSVTAPAEDRHSAIWTLWNSYRERRIWLDRGFSSDHHSDAGALLALLRAGAPAGFAREVLRALGDAEPTLRGNALELLPVLLDEDTALPLVRSAIRDRHPVVRRRAAIAAYLLKLTELAGELLAQAAVDDDEMATETLTDFALDLTPPEGRIAVARAANPRVARRVGSMLVRLAPRDELLAAIRAGELDRRLLDEIVDATGTTEGTGWSASDVLALAHIIAEHEDELLGRPQVEELLHAHVRVTLAAWLSHSSVRDREWDMEQMLFRCSDADLEELTAILAGPLDQIAAALVPNVTTGTPDPTAVAAVHTLVTEALLRRRLPPTPLVDRPRRQRGLLELVDEGDRSGALRRSPPRSDAEPLPEVAEITLRAWVADAWRERLAEHGLVPPLDPSQDMAWLRSLQWAAWADLPLAATDWAVLARAVLHLPSEPLLPWLRRRASPEIWDALRTQLPDWTAHDVIAVPRLFTQWPAGLAAIILDRLHEPELDDPQRLAAATAVLDRDNEQAVRAWLPQVSPRWLRPLLVRLGDCTAEQSLVGDLTAAPASWSRWPDRISNDWMRHVRCLDSADPLQELIAVLLRAGHEIHDIESVFQALERCAGIDALRHYDELAADPTIPSGRYLHYQRQRTLDAAAEREALKQLGDPIQTAEIVRTLVPPTENSDA